MSFWRIIPPLPHPYWAQSVAPAGWQGRVPRQSRPPLPPRRGCRPHPSRAPSPKGGGLPTKMAAFNKCPAAYSPATAPALLGMPKAGAMADGAAIAPASPPPTPHGVDFYRAQTTNAPPFAAPCKPPPCSGAPRRERWRTEPPSPPPARPPPLTGWISFLI